MALQAYYNTGTASVANGSTAVTGQGTAWASIGLKAGDMFLGKDGRVAIIASVESNTALTLLAAWPGTTQAEAVYAIQPSPPGVELPIMVRELVDLLGTHAFFDPDAAGDLAGRDTYDDRDAGFSYLDLDEGELYFKASNTDGDWAGPFSYATGPKGDKGDKGPQGPSGDGSGDMLVSIYDPQEIGDDAFNRANHTGAEVITADFRAIQLKPATVAGVPYVQWTDTAGDEVGRLLYDADAGGLRITDRDEPGGAITAEIQIDGPNNRVKIAGGRLNIPASNGPTLTDAGDIAIDLNGDEINTDGVLKFVDGAGKTVTVWGSQKEPAEVDLGQVFAFDGLEQRPRWGAVTGRRNLIIGGCFDTNPWQRGTSFTAPGNGDYTADMFNAVKVGSGVFDIQRTVDSPDHQMINATGTYCLDLEVTTAEASLAANSVYGLRYMVEGYDWTQIAWHAMNLSFYVKASVAGTYCVAMRSKGGDRVLIAEYTIDAANTWQRVIIPMSGGIDPAGGTWDFEDGVGCTIIWVVAAGPSRHGVDTGGIFTDQNKYATANQTNLMATVGNHFKIDRIQLENSQISTRFEYQSRGEVLAACRRYYRKFDGRLRLNATVGTADSTARGGTLLLDPPMRAAPTISGETWQNSWADGPNYQISAEAVEITGNMAASTSGQALTGMILDASL